MSELYESSLQGSSFIPLAPPRSTIVVERAWEPAPTKLTIQRSAIACAFLVMYLAAYLGVGYAGITLIERAWLSIFK